MLPIVVIVANMLTVKSACSFDTVQEPSCFTQKSGPKPQELQQYKRRQHLSF